MQGGGLPAKQRAKSPLNYLASGPQGQPCAWSKLRVVVGVRYVNVDDEAEFGAALRHFQQLAPIIYKEDEALNFMQSTPADQASLFRTILQRCDFPFP